LGLVKSVSIGTENPGSAVIIPAAVFQATATIYAPFGLQNANKTRLKAARYANDAGKAAPCNK
jgi:hypothetical protein